MIVLLLATFTIVVVIVVLLLTGTVKINKSSSGKNPKTDPKTEPKSSSDPKSNYYSYRPFEVGLIKNKPCEASNLCNKNVLYPIQNLDVDYNDPDGSIPQNCPCAQFVQAP